MSPFDLLLWCCLGLYGFECLLWVPGNGLLFLAWAGRFRPVEGPGIRLRNPWPAGFAYRFPPSEIVVRAETALSLEAARQCWQDYQKPAKILNRLSRGLLCVVVLCVLLYVFRRGFWLAWGVLAFSFLFLHLSILITFWSAHRRLFPGRNFRRVVQALRCLVSPWQSSRAADLLAERLLEGFHPLLVGRLLLEEGDFLRLARQWLLQLRYPAKTAQGLEFAPFSLLASAPAEEKALLDWLAGLGIDVESLLKAPRPTATDQKSYCPRCEAGFTIVSGRCNDCGQDLKTY